MMMISKNVFKFVRVQENGEKERGSRKNVRLSGETNLICRESGLIRVRAHPKRRTMLVFPKVAEEQ